MALRSKTALTCLVALTLIGGFASAARAQAKQPVTHDALWLMPRVGAPSPSPDAKWVVFSVTEPAYDEKDQQSDLWVVPADGSVEARRLTRTKAAESGVAWSPDSRRIAFVTRREGDEAVRSHPGPRQRRRGGACHVAFNRRGISLSAPTATRCCHQPRVYKP